ncbi:MAG: hypothetical protein K8E66_11415, partial [Phycisphaerales bacterium]|nr:hypothetical protein [Phycisphaerales bacterium]
MARTTSPAHDPVSADETPGPSGAPIARGGPLPWTNLTIDSPGDVGSQLSVAPNPSTNPASPLVAYYDASTNGGDLKFATLDSAGAWVSETVLSTADDEGNATSIAIGSLGGDRHIIHYDQTNSTWEHAWGQPGNWQHETIENLGAPGAFGLDSGLGVTDGGGGDVLYAAYPDVSATGIRFAQKDFGSWTITPHEVGLNVRDIDLVVDSDFSGTAHLAYVDTDSYDLHYATRTFFGTFASEIAQTDVGCEGCMVSIALDSLNRPHIIYTSGTANSAVVHTWLDSGTWFAEDIESGTAFNDFTSFSLEIDDFDNLHVAYRNGVTGQLTFARKIGGSWSTQNVAAMGAAGGVQYV